MNAPHNPEITPSHQLAGFVGKQVKVVYTAALAEATGKLLTFTGMAMVLLTPIGTHKMVMVNTLVSIEELLVDPRLMAS